MPRSLKKNDQAFWFFVFWAFVGLLWPVGLLIVALDLAMVRLCFTNECTNFGTSLLCGFVCATKRRQYDDAESRKPNKKPKTNKKKHT